MNVVSLFPSQEMTEGLLVGLDANGDLIFRTFGELDNRTALWILECAKMGVLTGDYSEESE